MDVCFTSKLRKYLYRKKWPCLAIKCPYIESVDVFLTQKNLKNCVLNEMLQFSKIWFIHCKVWAFVYQWILQIYVWKEKTRLWQKNVYTLKVSTFFFTYFWEIIVYDEKEVRHNHRTHQRSRKRTKGSQAEPIAAEKEGGEGTLHITA